MMDAATFDAMLEATAVVDPVARDTATDEVTDVYRDLDPDQAIQLAQQLLRFRLQEMDANCQDAQLNALCDLKDYFEIPASFFQELRKLRVNDLGPQEEYVRILLDEEE